MEATSETSRSPSSRLLTKSSIASSLTPRGSTRTAWIWELWMWITSPVTARRRVRRSETSSTTPWSSRPAWTTTVSPTENQRSVNIVTPAMMSMRIRWAAKPATMMAKDAPAIAVSRSTPPVSWASERTMAAPTAT